MNDLKHLDKLLLVTHTWCNCSYFNQLLLLLFLEMDFR